VATRDCSAWRHGPARPALAHLFLDAHVQPQLLEAARARPCYTARDVVWQTTQKLFDKTLATLAMDFVELLEWSMHAALFTLGDVAVNVRL